MQQNYKNSDQIIHAFLTIGALAGQVIFINYYMTLKRKIPLITHREWIVHTMQNRWLVIGKAYS